MQIGFVSLLCHFALTYIATTTALVQINTSYDLWTQRPWSIVYGLFRSLDRRNASTVHVRTVFPRSVRRLSSLTDNVQQNNLRNAVYRTVRQIICSEPNIHIPNVSSSFFTWVLAFHVDSGHNNLSSHGLNQRYYVLQRWTIHYCWILYYFISKQLYISN